VNEVQMLISGSVRDSSMLEGCGFEAY